jgi:hypothetical protein
MITQKILSKHRGNVFVIQDTKVVEVRLEHHSKNLSYFNYGDNQAHATQLMNVFLTAEEAHREIVNRLEFAVKFAEQDFLKARQKLTEHLKSLE